MVRQTATTVISSNSISSPTSLDRLRLCESGSVRGFKYMDPRRGPIWSLKCENDESKVTFHNCLSSKGLWRWGLDPIQVGHQNHNGNAFIVTACRHATTLQWLSSEDTENGNINCNLTFPKPIHYTSTNLYIPCLTRSLNAGHQSITGHLF